MSRIILIGDTHGMNDALFDLIGKFHFNENDRIILLGDMMDRGPESFKIIRLVRAANLESIYGNHEDKHVRWRDRCKRELSEPGFKNKMHPLTGNDLEQHNLLSDDDIAWMASLPKFIKFEALGMNWLAVHGGFVPNQPYDQQARSLVCRVGWLDKETMKPFAWRKNLTPGDYTQPEGSIHWTELWDQPYNVVYGHIVHNLEKPRVYTTPNNMTTYGIDTGICFGGRLTALVINTINNSISFEQV